MLWGIQSPYLFPYADQTAFVEADSLRCHPFAVVFSFPSFSASWGVTSSLCLGSGSVILGEGLFWGGRDILSCCLPRTTRRMLFEVVKAFIKARAVVTALSSAVSSCRWFSSPSSVAPFPRHTLRTFPTCCDDVRIWMEWSGRRMHPAGLSMSGPWDVSMLTSQLLTRDVIALVWSGSWLDQQSQEI